MKYLKHILSIVFVFQLHSIAISQVDWNSIQFPLKIKDDTLKNPFTGGINAAQIGKIFLNNDTQKDLVVFDRANNRVLTFLADSVNKQWNYAPLYENFFPKMSNWALFRDYNNDGKVDIFTYTNLGIKLYKNETPKNGLPKFRLIEAPLLSKGFSGRLNIQSQSIDIPAIADIDGDGDIDILTIDTNTGGTLQMHENRSTSSDTMIFTRINDCWGGFDFFACNDIRFGLSCETKLRKSTEYARIQHTTSGALLTFDFNQDSLTDLLLTKQGCKSAYLFENKGSKNLNPIYNAYDTTFNFADIALRQNYSAAIFKEDVNFDKIDDIILTYNEPVNNFNENLQSSIHLYEGENINSWKFKKHNFLQESMLDLGEYSSPIALDVDGDNDQDLLISSTKFIDNKRVANLTLLKNTNTFEQPIFEISDTNYLNFKISIYSNIKIVLSDINLDSKKDLVFIAQYSTSNTQEIYYIANVSTSSDYQFSSNNTSLFQAKNASSLHIADIDNNGYEDIILGKNDGSLEAWGRNSASINYSLVTDSLAGYSSNYLQQQPSLASADINNNGKTDWFVCNNSGECYYALDTILYPKSPKWTKSNINLNAIAVNNTSHLGINPNINIIALDTSYQLIAGNISGGIQLFSTKASSKLTNPEESDFVNLYPNPAENFFIFYAEKNGFITIYDALGKEYFSTNITAFDKNKINTTNLKSGIYFVKFINSTNKNSIHKLVIK
ncbi:MAG: hypothetical protein RLZZ175_1874 [Bacteroidota bacterium]|jgi:hypothetical protein